MDKHASKIHAHARDSQDTGETWRTCARLGGHARQGSTENSNYSMLLVERVPSKLRITRVFRHSLTVFWPKLEATRNLQEDVHSEMIDRIAIGRHSEHWGQSFFGTAHFPCQAFVGDLSLIRNQKHRTGFETISLFCSACRYPRNSPEEKEKEESSRRGNGNCVRVDNNFTSLFPEVYAELFKLQYKWFSFERNCGAASVGWWNGNLISSKVIYDQITTVKRIRRWRLNQRSKCRVRGLYGGNLWPFFSAIL